MNTPININYDLACLTFNTTIHNNPIEAHVLQSTINVFYKDLRLEKIINFLLIMRHVSHNFFHSVLNVSDYM